MWLHSLIKFLQIIVGVRVSVESGAFVYVSVHHRLKCYVKQVKGMASYNLA